MNTDLDSDFEQAYLLAERVFTQDQLVEFLKSGDIKQRQIAALKLSQIRNKEEAAALVGNLVGCDGKIREAVALRINRLIIGGYGEYFTEYYDRFADATIDINANICRLVTDSAALLKADKNFSKNYASKILSYAKNALAELDKFACRDKKYVINKQLFKLYWCLETMKNFYEFIDDESLKSLLEKCSEVKEYTIREKVAELVVLADCFPELFNKLSRDENYYVRAAF